MSNLKKADRKKPKKTTSLPKVLVAGGAGFVGSHLCRTLLDQNCQVFCIDNLSTGKKRNLAGFLENENFQFFQRDISSSLASFPKMDYVFHLAGLDYFLGKKDLSLQKILANSKGTRNLLEFVRNKGGKFLYASSVNVFQGHVSKKKLNEYFGEQSEFYSSSEGNRFSETLTFEYFESFDINARIVRLVDVFGPRMNLSAGGRIAQLFSSFLFEEKIKIPGEGEETLYPAYVQDVVLGLFKAMFTKDSAGKVYTLAGMEKKTLSEFAHLIKDLKKEVPVEYVQGKPFELTVDEEEILLAQELLNWRVETGVKQGIRRSLQWLNNQKESLLADQQAKKRGDELQKDQKEKTTQGSSASPQRQPGQTRRVGRTSDRDSVFTAKPVQPLELQPEKKTKSDTEAERVKKKETENVLLEKEEGGFQFPRLNLPKITLQFSFFKIVFPLFFLLLVVLSPFALLAYFSHSQGQSLAAVQRAKQAGDFREVEKRISRAKTAFSQGEKILFFLTRNIPFLSNQKHFRQLAEAYSLSDAWLASVKKEQQLSNQAAQLKKLVFAQQTGNLRQEVANVQMFIEELHQKYGLLAGEIDLQKDYSVKLVNKTFTPILKERKTLKEQADRKSPLLRKADRFLEVLPQLVALEGKQRYLVLFQDSMEIRPTGGFISSVGILTLEKGKILDFQVQDVYFLDKQLSGEVDPPEEIKEHLGEKNWYLRDSNWSPDFRKSALQAEWFVEKETGKGIDGVIAVDWSFLRGMLQVVGPVKPTFYDQQINAQNLMERAIQYYKTNASSEDADKEQFLGKLIKLVFDKFAALGPGQTSEVFSQWGKDLQEKHLLLSFHDQAVQEKVEGNGWGGLLRGSIRRSALISQRSKNHLFDFSMAVDANVGINKVNFFVDRKQEQEVSIAKDGTIRKTVFLSWENKSTSKSWPGGEYKNYFRFYVPPESQLVDVKTGNSRQNLKLLPKDKIDIQKEYFKKSYGFLVQVPAGEKKVVKLEYQLERKLRFSKGTARYHLYSQKQPGMDANPLEIEIVYPQNIKPAKVSTGGKVSGNKVIFSTKLNQDKIFLIQFLK